VNESFGQRISQAVAAASDGDMVIVYPGTYKESVTIEKSIRLRSKSSVLWDCNGGRCLTIAANTDWVEVYGIEFFNGSTAIYSAMTNNTSIKFCTIHNNKVGVDIGEGSNNVVSYNNFYDNDNFAIFYGETSELDAEYNYWYADAGPVYCTAISTIDVANCTFYTSGISMGDNVSNADYTPWVRARIADWDVTNITAAGFVTIDTRDVTNAIVELNTTPITQVFTLRFAGNPGTGFVTNIGKFIDLHMNRTANNVLIKIYYAEEDMYGKIESSAKIYYWDGELSDYWRACNVTGVNQAENYAYCWVNATGTEPLAANLTGIAFGIGVYSDPVGGIALSVDKLSLIAHLIIAALAILIPILRNLNR
jgi:hypothetical protein